MLYDVVITIPSVPALTETEAIIKGRNMAQIWDTGYVQVTLVEIEED